MDILIENTLFYFNKKAFMFKCKNVKWQNCLEKEVACVDKIDQKIYCIKISVAFVCVCVYIICVCMCMCMFMFMCVLAIVCACNCACVFIQWTIIK